MSQLYDSFVPGALARIQTGQSSNRIRKKPEIPSDPAKVNENVTGWLPAESLLVILRAPAGWTEPYPYENDNHVWVYAYAGKALNKTAKTATEHAVGWTAAGPTSATETEKLYMDVIEPGSLTG